MSTTSKDMDNIIPYERNCSECLNGCPISTKRRVFKTSFPNDHGEIHVLANRVPICPHMLQNITRGGEFNALGYDDGNKSKESKKKVALMPNKKKKPSKNHRPTVPRNIYGKGENVNQPMRVLRHHPHILALHHHQKMTLLCCWWTPMTLWWSKKYHRQKEKKRSCH